MKEIKYYTLYLLERAKYELLKDTIAKDLLNKQLNLLCQKDKIEHLELVIKELTNKNKELKKENIEMENK